MILSFHMPLFFVASGYLCKKTDENFSCVIYRKIKTLLIPTIVFQFFNVVILFFLKLIDKQNYIDNFSFAGFWFLEALFIVFLFWCFLEYKVLNIVKSKNMRCLCLNAFAILGLFIGLFVSQTSEKENYSVIIISLIGFFYYVMGINLRNIKIIDYFASHQKLYRTILLIASSLCGMLLYVTCTMNEVILMYNNTYGNTIWFLANSIVGILMVFMLSYSIKRCKVIEYYGRNSLIILITHFPIYQCIRYLLYSFFKSDVIVIGLTFMLTILLEYIVTIIANKRFGFLFGRF